MVADAVLLALLALVFDALQGEPKGLYRRFPHPIVVMGRLAAWWEARFNRIALRDSARALLGGLGLILLILAAALVGTLIHRFCARLWLADLYLGILLEGLIASAFIAGRSLSDHVRAVQHGLEISLAEGRRAVRHLVGRSPERLDRAAVGRASLESLAENTSDGVIAPLFWCLIGGLPALMAYKAVNTLDSLWGHRTARYLWFGKAAARLDDLVNLIPARLTALLVTLAALPRSLGVIRLSLRDAPHHRSPNAGWPEAAFAAALHLKLGGPRTYPQEGEIDAATLGEGNANVTSGDIDRALRLYRRTLSLTALLLALGAALAWVF